jgi:hypothetical protein
VLRRRIRSLFFLLSSFPFFLFSFFLFLFLC